MRQPLIRAEHLHLRRHGRAILDDVSLTVHAGDFITVVGPNGAGKTTLLKCLLGLTTPQQGAVWRQPDLKTGYVPQRMAAALTFPLQLRRFLTLNNGADAAQVEEVAHLTDIAARLDAPLAQLSGGELQRALLARALIDRPALLALDEPVQNLDVGGEIAFYRLLEKICDAREVAVLMVSHDLHFVLRRSRQVVCLYHHICCAGAPQIVSKDPAFEALFGSELAQMMAVYQHAHDHSHDHDHGDHGDHMHAAPAADGGGSGAAQ